MACGGYTYEGDWQDDAMHGNGRFAFASGATYTGQWRANKYEGLGTYMWPDGSRYEVCACGAEWWEGRWTWRCVAAWRPWSAFTPAVRESLARSFGRFVTAHLLTSRLVPPAGRANGWMAACTGTARLSTPQGGAGRANFTTDPGPG